jgi:hypothetical protein
MLAARRFAQENPQAGQANLAAEGPPPAKPSTAARTSFAADAAEWEHEEKNAHHADNHPKNGVVPPAGFLPSTQRRPQPSGQAPCLVGG